MKYHLMRIRKYYDAVRTNDSFKRVSLKQKSKILKNIFNYYVNRKKPVVSHKPVVAQIEPTSECNLDCEMCIRKEIGVPIGSMKFKDFKKILDELDCLFKLHLSGQGEPFLNKDIFKIIKYANEKGVLVNLNTNGILLTKSLVEKICKVNLGEIAISIESTKKQKYEKIRKGSKFEVLINNIKNLNFTLEKNNKNTIISFAVTVLKSNIFELPDFVKLAYNVGIKKLVIQTIQEKKDYVRKYSKEAKKQMDLDSGKIKFYMDKAKELGRKLGISLIFDEEKIQGCLWPWRSIYITWNGYITPCCKILDYRKPFFGNILKEDFWRVWNGKEYQVYRRLLRDRKAPLGCKGCNMV